MTAFGGGTRPIQGTCLMYVERELVQQAVSTRQGINKGVVRHLAGWLAAKYGRCYFFMSALMLSWPFLFVSLANCSQQETIWQRLMHII